jgi:methyl-accepting chemotaxis protein
MKLGTRITLGFELFIIIAIALGGLAIWSMLGAKRTAVQLAEAKMPETKLANDVERKVLQILSEGRSFAFTEEKHFLDTTRQLIKEAGSDIASSKSHATKIHDNDFMKSAENAEAKVLVYGKLLTEIVGKTEGMAKEKAASMEAVNKYTKVCYEFLDNQKVKLNRKIKELANQCVDAQSAVRDPKPDLSYHQTGNGSQPAATASQNKTGNTDEDIVKVKNTEKSIKTLLGNINLAYEIVDMCKWIQIGNWQAIATRDPKLFKDTMEIFGLVNAKLDELQSSSKDAENLKSIEECRAAGKDYMQSLERFVTYWFAREDLNKKQQGVVNEFLKTAKESAQVSMRNTTTTSLNAASSLSLSSTVMMIGLAIAVVVGNILAFFITRGITKPIRRIIQDLTGGADQVAAAAGEISTVSQQAAEGASEQAAALEETSAALEEMGSTSKINADNATKANTMMAQATEVVTKSQTVMNQTSDAMAKINEASAKIASIIKVIEDIAFQTNLLALNAAVEAARAGEHGKGFAVVAGEVRNLAGRSAKAANETAQLISDTIERVKKGTSLNGELAVSFAKVNEVSLGVAQLVDQIAKASGEQAKGVDQVNTATVQMNQVVQHSAANAEESAAAAEQLSNQSQVLMRTVDQLVNLVGGTHSDIQNLNTEEEEKEEEIESSVQFEEANPNPPQP